MDPDWFAPEGRPFRGANQSVLTFAGICFASLLIPPGKVRIALTMPALLYVATRFRQYSSGQGAQDYMAAVNLALFGAKWIDFVLLGVPERDIYRVDMSQEGNPPVKEDAGRMILWQKCRWSGSLWTNLRGVGWNWQVKNVDNVPLTITTRYVYQDKWFLSSRSWQWI
jgi:hypothetical protein